MDNVSILGRIWKLDKPQPEEDIVTTLLRNRGITDASLIQKYLNPDFSHFHDPFLMEDMEGAVNRIQKAIENKERVIVFGDYDVDGVTGTAIVYLALKELGAAVSYRLPSRNEDGYGLNEKLIDEIKGVDTKLLITVDCGISCNQEINYAKEKGIDVIITDHHTIPDEIPQANFILHPKQDEKYPFDELTGAGVALKLASALLKDKYDPEKYRKKIQKYLDLATLGTIADLGPLQDENRLIVRSGLRQMQITEWEGLYYLLEICGLDPESEIDASHIGFRIAPRINAAGRLDSPYYALKLFLSSGNKARKFAQKLEKINKERQRLTEIIINEAEEIVSEQLSRERILIAYHPGWKSGLVGIIAGRLSSNHSMPVIIMEERDENYIGSARGPEYFNMVEALRHCEDLLENYGGHLQAAGFTLPKKNLDEFVQKIQKYAREEISKKDQVPVLDIDAILQSNRITKGLIKSIDKLKPFGQKNPKPIFVLEGVSFKNIKKVGQDKKHALGKIKDGEQEFSFIAFSLADEIDKIDPYKNINVAFHLGLNTFRGKTSIQLQVIDIQVT
jgi:single-stranded-DNA-specific exonuclease